MSKWVTFLGKQVVKAHETIFLRKSEETNVITLTKSTFCELVSLFEDVTYMLLKM